MGNTSFSSGFATGYNITSNWKANKEKKDMIKKEEEEMKSWGLELGAMYDRDRRSGTGISQQEYEDGCKIAMIAGTEQFNMLQALYGNSMNMTAQAITGELEQVKLMREACASVDLKDRDAMRELISTLKYPKSKSLAEATLKQWDAQDMTAAEDEAKEPEYFTSLLAVKEKYGEEAQGQFASGKGWIYTGEEKKAPKSSDYINAINTLGAVAKGKTDEEFQVFKTNYEKETGINLGKISRTDLLQIDPEEIKKADFNTVMDEIMAEYVESAQALDDEAKREILTKWKLYRPLMNNKDQQRGDVYMAEIGIDMNMPDEPTETGTGEGDPKEKWYSYENITKWVEDWSNTVPEIPETKGGLK